MKLFHIAIFFFFINSTISIQEISKSLLSNGLAVRTETGINCFYLGKLTLITKTVNTPKLYFYFSINYQNTYTSIPKPIFGLVKIHLSNSLKQYDFEAITYGKTITGCSVEIDIGGNAWTSNSNFRLNYLISNDPHFELNQIVIPPHILCFRS